MAVAERVEQLRDSELFSDLDQDALARIAADATEYDCPADTVLIEAGVPASGVFIIVEGEVAAETHDGRHHQLGPGDSFGELSLLAGTPRTGRVRAVTPLRALALDRNEFETILNDEPTVARALLKVLAKRLVEAQASRR
jgi:CRP/FNR family transcriptional regulator, cyclic AMP receptor protein